MSTTVAEPVSHPWRRHLRFSVRTLIILVLVCGGGLGWWIHVVREQRDAVAAVRKAGGVVHYEWKWKHGKFLQNGAPKAPKWLVDRVGVDSLGSVTAVDLQQKVLFRLFSDRRDLNPVLARVGRLKRLEYLNLGHSSVTDSDLAHLKSLAELKSLLLNSTNVGDSGLGQLKGLTSLERLSLTNTKVTDAGLVSLGGMTGLTWLDLNNTQISDAGLRYLKKLAKLERLSLSNTKVTGDGLAHLKELPNLRLLNLNGNAITKVGVKHLKNLGALKSLSLDKSDLSDAEVTELRRGLPKARVIR